MSESQKARLAKAQEAKAAANQRRLDVDRKAGADWFARTANEQQLANERDTHQDQVRASGDWVSAMGHKQDIEDLAEDQSIVRYNDKTALEAERLSIQEKAKAQKVASYGALLANGGARVGDKVVNVNDVQSVGAYHRDAIARYQNASSEAERDEIMAQIKAAQNVLSKTDKGRTQVGANFRDALSKGETKALGGASAHIMGDFGDKYKAVNRGDHAMYQDLATVDTTSTSDEVSRKIQEVQNNLDKTSVDAAGNTNIELGGYSLRDIDKYTTETFVNALWSIRRKG